ncbi:hypothetical protein T05_13122 [Trichinella murrelli]|uniref:Uncharacterized protein n=1 Tax=Trichinella murrelli TaxID=144512 RepID=A0A0V0U999_9BILA|nr:hypothetical protein T05_13122 [Trichinella murrelli]
MLGPVLSKMFSLVEFGRINSSLFIVISENKRSEMRIWKRPFVRIPLVVDVVVCALLQIVRNPYIIPVEEAYSPLCIRYERSDQSVSIVLFSKDDRNIATKRPAALKLRSA